MTTEFLSQEEVLMMKKTDTEKHNQGVDGEGKSQMKLMVQKSLRILVLETLMAYTDLHLIAVDMDPVTGSCQLLRGTVT